MKLYILVHETNTENACGAVVTPFTDLEIAKATMRQEWVATICNWSYDSCESCDNSAVIRKDINTETWRIEERELPIEIAVDVHDGRVESVYANADVSVEVYDRDIESNDELLHAVEEELQSHIDSSDWRTIL